MICIKLEYMRAWIPVRYYNVLLLMSHFELRYIGIPSVSRACASYLYDLPDPRLVLGYFVVIKPCEGTVALHADDILRYS